MAHPHLKEARDGHSSKLKRLAGFHGTSANPTGNDPVAEIGNDTDADGKPIKTKFGARRVETPSGPQKAVGLAEGVKPRKNLGKFARGGRAKHKGTNVNIIVGHPGAGAMPGAMPGGPPMGAAPALPMRPPMPPPMPGGPPPGMAPPGGMPPPMPPGGMMPPHRNGGRTFKRGGRAYEAGAGSGEGREEKIKAYGRKAHGKPKAV